jgi:hypothetical protein
MNGTIHQEEIIIITIINIYEPNVSTLNFIKQMLLDTKAQIGHHIIIVDNLNTLLS